MSDKYNKTSDSMKITGDQLVLMAFFNPKHLSQQVFFLCIFWLMISFSVDIIVCGGGGGGQKSWISF